MTTGLTDEKIQELTRMSGPREITDEKIQELARMSRAELNRFMRKLKEEWWEQYLKNLKGQEQELIELQNKRNELAEEGGNKPQLEELDKEINILRELLKTPPTKEHKKALPITYMEGIKTRIKAIKSTPSGQQEIKEREKTEQLLSMNIYDKNKVLLRNNGLYRIPLRGKITIKNPIELDDSQKKELTDVKNMPKAYYQNIKLIISTLNNIFTETETKQLSINFPVNKYLGAIDVSKKENRIAVYQYWERIAKLYPKVKSAIEGFFEAIDESTLSDERKEKFQKLYSKTITKGGQLVTQLEYIAIFEEVDTTVLDARDKFMNIITEMIALERLFDNKQEYKGDSEEMIESEGAGAVWDEYAESQKQTAVEGFRSDAMGEAVELNLDDTNYDVLPEDFKLDVKRVTMAADPLLAYEYNQNKRLLSMTNTMHSDLLKELKKLEIMVKKDADSDVENEISVNSAGDVKRWIRELEDTTVIDENEETPQALPISVLNNTDFARLYKIERFKTVESETIITVGNLDEIKNFFGDLHDLLRDKEFRGAIAVRTSKRESKTDMNYRDKAASKTLRGVTGRLASMGGKGSLSGEFDDIKGKLQTLLDVTRDYYFDPLYSGLMPIEIPQFGSSIGAKVLQMFDKDLAALGMESVMSGAYDNLFEGSADSIDPDKLNDISVFLKRMFLPNIEITTSLIDSGEAAATALTSIFGKEEINDNYCAALIVHFMEDVGDMSKINEFFHRVPIGERAEKFNEHYISRKAIPVFALPHWLDMNQGVLTSTDAKKKEYNQLKEVFESVEADLPILLYKLLKAHDAVRKALGKDLIHGYYPLNTLGVNEVINKMQVEEDIDLSHLEVEQIVKAVDSHKNISEDYGISGEQVYMVKALFR